MCNMAALWSILALCGILRNLGLVKISFLLVFVVPWCTLLMLVFLFMRAHKLTKLALTHLG